MRPARRRAIRHSALQDTDLFGERRASAYTSLMHRLLALMIVGPLCVPVAHAQPRGPAREIIPLTGDLYRARNGNWYTIFLVTRDGIILGDPINPAFASWLKGELATRFTVPVR